MPQTQSAVQEYLARTVTTGIFDAIGVEERLDSALATYWVRANRFAHEQMVAAVRGRETSSSLLRARWI